ncbi:MAG: arsenate reductase ArsC [Chloroflexota bacterium]
MTDQKRRVLFLCTHNSARSQMAEALLRHMASDTFEVYSAGNDPTGVNPFAVEAMKQINIDISGAESKHLDQYVGQDFDYVITVCDKANESCPVFPGDPNRIHWSFEDPSAAEGTDEEKLDVFRKTRDRINMRLRNWLLAVNR